MSASLPAAECEDFAGWAGRTREAVDVATAAPVRALAATLDLPVPAAQAGDPIPPAWHWLYFLATAAQAELGPDGAEARGEFLPPVPLPRRMWAGGSFVFHRPLRVGETLHRLSTIRSITSKTGRQGKLVFVTVSHEISGATGPAVTEEQIIVYRPAARPGEAATPVDEPADRVWRRTVPPDPILLFRFSALTFNGHRIHYDRPYATSTEGYPGLVVHGPLQAMLLLELARAAVPERPVRRFEYRALAPIFDTAPFTVNGRLEDGAARLWTADGNFHLGMSGRAEF
ncbi:MAG: 3-methylfumaryl-CoA hydratase [Aliidongia sp.]|nr:3-methylfumaryl-CoA hydratase [Aliidongia sp.]